MSPRRTLAAAAAFLGLVFAGSAASAIPVPSVGQPSSEPTNLRERLRTQFAESFSGIQLPKLRPDVIAAPEPSATTAAVPSADPFPNLGAGQFAVYASATVNHTKAPLTAEDLGRDLNLATSHAVHSGSPLPAWDSEIGRQAFPELAAGLSRAKAWAAELSNPDDLEENSEAPLEPVVATAPPTQAPVIDDLQVNVGPVKDKALRVEAAARALKSGCVIGSDLSLGRAEANDTNVGDLSGDPKSPKPILSLDAETPPRAISQSLARTRLVPINGAPNRFGVVAETRETIAPVTFFKGDRSREVTIEVAGEWVLRATADGSVGSVTLGVENAPDDLPLLRVIRRDSRGDTNVVSIFTLDDLADLAGPMDLGNGLELIIGEAPRALRGATGTATIATGTRAIGALDILRLQVSDDPSDAFVRIGHMEAGVAVPAGGVTCPGIGVTKKSSQATVEAGNRFNWVIDVSNPNDCILDNVQLVDTTQPSRGLLYRVTSTSPTAKVDGDTVIFDGIGPLQTGASRSLRVDVEVDPASAAGRFTNLAVATGQCGSTVVSGASGDDTIVEPASPLGLVGRGGADQPVVRIGAARNPAGAAGPVPGGDVLVRPAPFPAPPETSSTRLARSAPSPQARAAGAARDNLAATGGMHSNLLGLALLVTGLVLRRTRSRLQR
jgi:hypothetical protein